MRVASRGGSPGSKSAEHGNGRSIGQFDKLKPGIAGAAAAGTSTDGNDATTAFASLLQLVGSRYGAGATIALAELETRLMQSNDTTPQTHAAETRDNDDEDNSSASTQPKAVKSDDKDDKSSNSGDCLGPLRFVHPGHRRRP